MKNNSRNNIKEEAHEEDIVDDIEDEEEDEEVEEDEEIEEEVEEDEEEEVDDDDETGVQGDGNKNNYQKGSSQATNASTQSCGQNANSFDSSQQNTGSSGGASGQAGDKRPRLTDELYEMNLRRKKEHVGSALYIPFPRKVPEEEVRNFVGQGPNIFLVGPQKQNAIVRYRTQSECEKQQKELAKKEFDGQTLNIEPKTVKIDPANIDVKTLIVQYSNPDLCIVDFACVFMKAISISLKGGKNKKESQEDLSFGSAIIIFPSHEEARDAFLATENLVIKDEKLRVVFADFRPTNQTTRTSSGGSGGFRNKGGDQNRGNFSRSNQGGGGRPGGSGGGGNFRNRNRNSNSSGGSQRNFGNRNFNSNNGGGSGAGGSGNFNQGRNFNSPYKKFRSNVR